MDLQDLADQTIESNGSYSFWKKRWYIAMLLLIAFSALIAILVWGMLDKTSSTGESGATRIGKQAPAFEMPSFSGGLIKLSDYKGRPVIINFWASWCGPCRVEAPALQAIWEKFRTEDLVVIGVNLSRQDPQDNSMAFLTEFGITYPNGTDGNGFTTIDYGVGGIPVTFFVNRSGTIIRRFVGSLNEMQLHERAEELIRGQGPINELDSKNLKNYYDLSQD